MRASSTGTVLLLAVALFLPLAVTPAGAEEASLQPWEAARKVERAVAEDRGDLVEKLAARDDPDPWLVADDLVGRRAFDAAQTFAAAAPRKDLEGLVAYVAARRGEATDTATREALRDAARLMYENKTAEAVARLEAAAPGKNAVLAARVAYDLGMARWRLEEHAAAAADFLRAAERAGEARWFARAALAAAQASEVAMRAGDLPLATRALRAGLEAESARGNAARVAETRLSLAWVLWKGGHPKEAAGIAAEALTTFADAKDARGEGYALQLLGNIESTLGEREKAREHLRASLARFASLEDKGMQAAVMTDLAGVMYDLGEHAEAKEQVKAALAMHERSGDRAGLASALMLLGVMHEEAADKEAARECYEKAQTHYEAAGDPVGVAGARGNLATLLASSGRMAEALTIQKEVLEVLREQGRRLEMVDMLGMIAINSGNAGSESDAKDYLEAALQLAEEVGDKGALVRILDRIAGVRYRAGDPEGGLKALERAKKLAAEVDEPRLTVSVTLAEAMIMMITGELRKAAGLYDRAHEIASRTAQQAVAVQTLILRAQVYDYLGRREESDELIRQALEQGSQAQDAQVLAFASIYRVQSLFDQGRYDEATELAKRLETQGASLGDFMDFTHRFAMAAVHEHFGDYNRALRALEQLALQYKTGGDIINLAEVHGRMADVYERTGDYARAMDFAERSRKEYTAVGSAVLAAQAELKQVSLIRKTGDPSRALSLLRQPLELVERMGYAAPAADGYHLLGVTLADLGDLEASRAALDKAQGYAEKSGKLVRRIAVAQDLSHVLARSGELAAAEALCRETLELARETGARHGIAQSLAALGEIQARKGETEAAKETLEKAIGQARRLRDASLLVATIAQLAELQFEDGDAKLALATANLATPALERVLGGHSAEQGALARARYADLYEVGALAAAKLKDPYELSRFLERGRAGALLEALGGRDGVRESAVPEHLREEERQARMAEAAARGAWSRALRRNSLQARREARKRLDAAGERLKQVIGKIQRSENRRSSLGYPVAHELDEIQDRLEKHDALVLYGMNASSHERDAIALVVTPSKARIVPLGKTADIEALCAALTFDEPRSDLASAIQALSKAIIRPLKLPSSVKRVIVSPDGALSYVPFAAVLPKRTVAYVPSGTTLGVLMEANLDRGGKVLALGDPAYRSDRRSGLLSRSSRGAQLQRLPGTRAEVQAIGDVVLLGEEANTPELLKALGTQKHWRSVHFACHGIVSREEPLLSALAVTATADDDGYLSAIEVMRMSMPSDLVVLSACETGRGRVVRSAGILGLTRAFMQAGAPRVICSLWKVDDEATRALMVKFYELWNPKTGEGLSTCEALRKAQEHVRKQEKWKHPYYWAAWSVWGLPD